MRRVLFLTAVALMPTLAFGNGAMSLALSVFSWPYWLAYVLATVVFEALALGWWLKCPMKRAVWISIVANLVTGILGGFISGVLGYGFLGVVGSTVNPDPFGQIVVMLTAFGVGSAVVEASVWRSKLSAKEELRPYAPVLTRSLAVHVPGAPPIVEASVWRSKLSAKEELRPYAPVLARSLAVHLLGVPLALSILLIPERPYPGLEQQVGWHRGSIGLSWEHQMRRVFDTFLAERERLPAAKDYPECLQRLRPYMDSVWPLAAQAWNGPEWWTLCYIPNYARFDRTEMKRNPILWNAELSGKAISQIKKPEWLIRWTTTFGSTQGLAVVPRPDWQEIGVERVWGETNEEFDEKVAALKP